MRATKFSEHKRGLIYGMLCDAYGQDERLVQADGESWREFDDFFFDNLTIADRCGFVTVEGDAPAGFVSWDPRKLPGSVEVGHNCVLQAYKGRGYGRWQMIEAVGRIKQLHPGQIIVSTGNTPFFLPARRMYEAAGFVQTGTFMREGRIAFEMVEYRILL